MPSANRSFRGVFDENAALYDKARPGYPNKVFEDIARLAQLSTDSRILEIGCGTGQATMPLASAGYEIVAVELGENLAAIARQKMKTFPDVRIDIGPFEEWPLQERSFDLVISATAFHWIDPTMRMQKVARALRAGGHLALVDTEHIAGGTIEFFTAVQRCYQQWDPAVSADFHLPSVEEIPNTSKEIDESGLFSPVTLIRYVREISYTASEYIDVLRTFSGQRHLPDSSRFELYKDIHHLIVNQFGGSITKAYLTELRIAKVLS